jgi:hypothetical protein
MKISSLVLASALALVPASVAFADDAKKEALKKAKEEAKKKALEAAKEKSEKKMEKAEKRADAKADAKAADDAAKAKAAEEEKQLHAKHLGLIERLEQIASATNNTELTAKAATLREKELKRHGLAAPAEG